MDRISVAAISIVASALIVWGLVVGRLLYKQNKYSELSSQLESADTHIKYLQAELKRERESKERYRKRIAEFFEFCKLQTEYIEELKPYRTMVRDMVREHVGKFEEICGDARAAERAHQAEEVEKSMCHMTQETVKESSP